MKQRIICIFLVIFLLLSLLPMAQAAKRGVYLSADSSFFAQLNLNTAGMEAVKTAVSAGNYTTAKSELLKYYKTKFASYSPIPADSKDANRVFFAMQDTWSMQQNRIGQTTINGTGFNFYSFGKTTNTTGYYLLDILDRPDYAIQICTRENEVESHRPILKCYDSSGNLISEVAAAADAMIHKGKPDTNYGTDNVLYVKSGMTQNSDGTYLPYNINSRRVYMKFDIPSGTRYTELVIYARLHGTTDNSQSLPLYQFDSFNKSWTESNLTWNYLVKLKAMGHYSWKNIPGAFDWKQPEGVGDYDWLDSNSRFYELTALTQTAVATTDTTQRAAYFAKIKEILLDFISDTTARTGFPVNRDREASSRMMNFPYIYKQLLAENVLTANQNKTILAYVYDELTFMDNGATIFDNTNGNHAASAYTNHSVYHLAGFYSAIAYWPEFKNNSSWRSRYESRVDFVLSTLINSDGSYNEVTFGYPNGVFATNSFLLYCMQERGDNSAVAKKYINNTILLARYLMNCCYPNGRNPYWGEGSPGSGILNNIKTFLSYLGNGYDNDPNVKALRHFINNAEGTAPDTVAQYTPVKIVSDRTGWTSKDSMLFMNAKCSGYHGHRDALALLYYYAGRSLLTDTGTTSASSSHPHYNFQHNSTRSHNTIEIDGKAQTWQKLPSAGADMGNIAILGNDSYSSISSWTKANTNDLSTTNASGSTVTHSTDFTHYRHVSYMKELGEIIFVSDKVVPADSTSHTYTQNWHSAPYSNPTIAADNYDTGRTNFASGANLLITQVNGSSITGSLQSGYDSSASGATTKYFQYKKTGSGTITYQTVLYPMAAGTSATVQPSKITMSGTSDATALASKIAVTDSSRPTVKTIYHYHAFESTPSTRTFDAYTTNAGTVTLVQDANGKLHFAALSKGASVSNGSTVILKAGATVTDLAATLTEGALYVESSDVTADYSTITVNFSGQTVKTVYYNGNPVPFTQASDGTVTIGGQYPLVHFNGEGLLSNLSQWSPHACTAAIKDGTMTGSLTASDPYVKSVAAFAYPLQKGDIVEIRIKYNITSGTYSGLQFFWLTEAAPNYNGTNRLLHSASSYPMNEYVTVRLNVSDSFVGDVMTGLRVDPVGTGTSNLPVGSYTIDYIYVGPASEAPSAHSDRLFFDFTDDRDAELRYTSSVYGDRNYDTENWCNNPSRSSVAYFDGETLRYSVVNGQTYNYIQTSQNGTLSALPLSYQPKADDWVQIRLRLENMQAVSGSTPSLSLYYLKNNVSAQVSNSDVTPIKGLETALSGQYVTLSAPMTDSFTSASVINAIRVSLSNITNVSGKTGRVYLDYIAIGAAGTLPVHPYTVTFVDAAGKILQTQIVLKGETAVYTGATPTKAADGTNHYSFKGWDKALTNITANTTFTAQFTATAHSYTYAKVDNTNHKGTCSCGYTVTTAHGWNSGSITTQPTCTATGIKTYTCNTCKATKTETVAALGHSYTTKVTAPTCTAQGYTTHTCSRCSDSYKDTYTNATGHSYTSKVTTAATCTTAGVKTFTCSKCSHSYTEAIAAAGHTVVTDKAVAATCTTAGKTEGSHCSVCNAVIKAQTTVPATGHSYTSKVTTAATCTTAGVKTFTCTKCSHSYTETIAATGHTVVTDKAVAATCTTAGKTEGSHCSVCNAVLVAQEVVAALGHDYGYNGNGDGTHTADCSRCDSTFTENHSFTNGACFCGDKEITVDESIKIYHTLDLASDISITFAVPMSALSDYDSFYLECALPEYEGNAQVGTSTVQIQPVVSGNYYYFTLTGITAVRMGDMVDAVLHMTKGTQAYISKTDSYSVATYAYAMLNSSSDTKMLTLCADLLRYGAEAQSFKKYRTDALVDANMTATHRSHLSNTNALSFTATDSYLGDLENASITWVGKTLDLGSKVGMKFVFNAKNYSGDISKLSMKVSYTGSNGETKTVTLTGAEVYNAANSYYSFTFYGLLASELRTIVDVAIFEGETQCSETLRYSAETYASKTVGTTLEPLTRALFAYSDSANAFFAK